MAGVPRARADDAARQPTDTPAPKPPPLSLENSQAEESADDPPETNRNAGHGRPIQVDYFSANLSLEASAERRSVRTNGFDVFRSRNSQRNKHYGLQETLGLESSGSLVDDRAVLYDAMFRAGLSQEEYWESRPGFDLHENPHGDLLEYDVGLQFFPAGKVSGNAFASKLDDRIARPFLPSLNRSRERLGGGVFFNDQKLPMSLTFEHLDDDISSGYRDLYDSEKRGEDTLRYEATWQQSEDHALNLEYNYERRDERFSGTRRHFKTERNYLALNDTIQFGQDRRSRLESILRLEDESGDIDRDSFEIAEQLRLQHSDSLYSTYRAQYLKESYGRFETDTVRGDIGLTHEWNKMLVSSIGAYALQQRADDFSDTNEWGGLANFAFNKDNSLGRFSSSLSLLHSNTRNDGGRTGGVIIDESVTFHDPLPVYLNQTRVDFLSILVRSPDRARIFVPGFDYFIYTNGDVTLLQRNPLGGIRDNETVLVSYTYKSFDSFNVSRDRLDYRIQQEVLKGLDVYYALSLQNEDINRSRYLTYRERDINRHRLGTTYRRPRWSGGLELEYNDDNIDPYKAFHSNADVVLLQKGQQQLDWRGTYSYFRFDGERFFGPRQTSLLDLGLTYRYAMATNLDANASAMYRFQNDSLFGRTNGVDVSASVAYKIGQFSLLVEAEYNMLDLPGSTDNSTGIWIKLRRDIPIIDRRSRN